MEVDISLFDVISEDISVELRRELLDLSECGDVLLHHMTRQQSPHVTTPHHGLEARHPSTHAISSTTSTSGFSAASATTRLACQGPAC